MEKNIKPLNNYMHIENKNEIIEQKKIYYVKLSFKLKKAIQNN